MPLIHNKLLKPLKLYLCGEGGDSSVERNLCKSHKTFNDYFNNKLEFIFKYCRSPNEFIKINNIINKLLLLFNI